MPEKQLFWCSSQSCIAIRTDTRFTEASIVIKLVFNCEGIPARKVVVAPTAKGINLTFSVRKGRLNVRSNLGKFFVRDGRIQDDRDIFSLSINIHYDLVLSNKHVHFFTHPDTVATIEGVVGLRAEQANFGRWQMVGQTM